MNRDTGQIAVYLHHAVGLQALPKILNVFLERASVSPSSTWTAIETAAPVKSSDFETWALQTNLSIGLPMIGGYALFSDLHLAGIEVLHDPGTEFWYGEGMKVTGPVLGQSNDLSATVGRLTRISERKTDPRFEKIEYPENLEYHIPEIHRPSDQLRTEEPTELQSRYLPMTGSQAVPPRGGPGQISLESLLSKNRSSTPSTSPARPSSSPKRNHERGDNMPAPNSSATTVKAAPSGPQGGGLDASGNNKEAGGRSVEGNLPKRKRDTKTGERQPDNTAQPLPLDRPEGALGSVIGPKPR